MKNLLHVFFMLLATAFAYAQGTVEKKTIQILPDSQLSITGDTNINKFRCGFSTDCLEKSQDIRYKQSGSLIKFENAVLVLPNNAFDCGNKAINKDFHALLQSEKYPEITLDLKQIKLSSANKGVAEVVIKIAGKQQTYRVPVDIKKGKVDNFIGLLKLNINDFNLQPPKKLFGVIVVKEDIEINFNLAVKN